MITLLTDFGVADYFVPAVKGVIYTVHSEARVVDVTHDIVEHDIESAAFTLGACYREFPAGTIHVAVVDPGVGSARRPIVVEAGGQIFVGPDNGIFSYVYAREADVRVYRIEREELFRRPVSPTFHGRDVFAPVAAHLEAGRVRPAELGERVADPVRIELPAPQPVAHGAIRGCLIQVDRFGNCVTNLTANELRLVPPGRPGPQWMLTVGAFKIVFFTTHFAAHPREGELFAYLGSAGYWEVGLWRASAAALIDARRGMEALLEPRWI